MSVITELESLETKSIDEIYLLMGEQLLAQTLGADDFSDEEKIDEAITWFNQSEKKLKSIICDSRIYAIYKNNPKRWDWVMIVAALADLISSATTGVPPATAAALLLKKGLDGLCSESE